MPPLVLLLRDIICAADVFAIIADAAAYAVDTLIDAMPYAYAALLFMPYAD